MISSTQTFHSSQHLIFENKEWLLPRRQLKKIALVFNISREKIIKFRGDNKGLQDKCFKKIVKACESDDWEKINTSSQLIFGIRHSSGKTLYDVLVEGEDAPPNFCRDLPENLVFQGGGAKGIAYIGVLEVLEEKQILQQVKRVAGTSAGSIIATLLAFDFNASEIKKLLTETPLTSFLDFPSFNGGLCKGQTFRTWMNEVIESKIGIKDFTFGELRQALKNGATFKHLHIVASKIGKNKEIVHFNSYNKEWDTLIIADAVRASMGLPGIFQPHYLSFKTEDGIFTDESRSYSDGGILANLPIEAFDKGRFLKNTLSREAGNRHIDNKKTLAFSLYNPGFLIPKADENVTWMGKAVVDSLSMRYHAESIMSRNRLFNKHRIVKISNAGVKTTQFGLSSDKMNELMNSGRAATIIFFREHEKRLQRLEYFIQGKIIDVLPRDSTTKIYTIFKYKTTTGVLIGIEIFGEKISIHTFETNWLKLALDQSIPEFSFAVLATKDPRFEIFAHLKKKKFRQAEIIFADNAIFFSHCFLWEIFIRLVIECNQTEYIQFFLHQGFSFNCKDINPILHAYKTNAIESFYTLLSVSEIDLRIMDPETKKPLYLQLIEDNRHDLAHAFLQEFNNRYPASLPEWLENGEDADEEYLTKDEVEKIFTFGPNAKLAILEEEDGNVILTTWTAIFTLPLLGLPAILVHKNLQNSLEKWKTSRKFTLLARDDPRFALFCLIENYVCAATYYGWEDCYKMSSLCAEMQFEKYKDFFSMISKTASFRYFICKQHDKNIRQECIRFFQERRLLPLNFDESNIKTEK